MSENKGKVGQVEILLNYLSLNIFCSWLQIAIALEQVE